MRRVWFVAFIPVIALLTVLHNPAPTRISTERPLEGVLSASGPVVVPEATTSEDLAQIDAWTRGVHDAEWYAGVQAELDRQEAARVAAQRSVTATRATPSATPADGDWLDRLAQCECGGNPSCNTGNGYYGTFQFTLSTWRAVGGEGLPSDASYEEQKARAAALLERASAASQFPGCTAKLGAPG